MAHKPAASPARSSSAVSVAAFATSSLKLQPSAKLVKLNPFTATDNDIQQNIANTHDSQAARQDVGSLYNVVSNIVRSSAHIGDSLDLKRKKSIELVEDKVPQSSFKPSYNMLKEIACQMTCKLFNTSTAHESVVGVLENLRSYTWDAKAVIALTAFSLDFGETWRLSLMQASKENALELHVFRFGDVEKPQLNADIISTALDCTLRIIEGIIWLENLIADKSYGPKELPALYKAPLDLYTYWAILGLLACANQMTELDRKVKSEIIDRLKIVLARLNADVEEIEKEKEKLEDLVWRFRVFQTRSPILELLRALILPKNIDIKQLDIFDGTTKEMYSAEVLKTMNLLLFISGLDNIEDEIWALKPIHESFTKNKDQKDYKILWVPVVDKWNDEDKEKFKRLKSLMPWYVVQYMSPIKGLKPLQEVWNYQGKPIVVRTDPCGLERNINALHLIFVWGISAFPFTEHDGDRLSQQWNWLWNAAHKIHPDIENWTQENNYVFLYGGTDNDWTQNFGDQVGIIQKDPIMKQTDTFIEQFNLGKVDPNIVSKFWSNINNSFLNKIQINSIQSDPTLKDIVYLLSMKNEKGWALLSKGENVQLVDCEVMLDVIMGFNDWKNNVLELQGFENAFKEYLEGLGSSHCVNLELNNIRSGVPMNICCPDPSCEMKLEIKSVNYKCCHGMHTDYAHVIENAELHIPGLIAK